MSAANFNGGLMAFTSSGRNGHRMAVIAASSGSGLGVALALLLGTAMAAQWLAWRFRVPAIVLLLSAGLLIGPVTGLLDVDDLLGDGLFPLVAVAVGLLLFHGGLEMDRRELARAGGAVHALITVGAAITFGLSAWAAVPLFGMDPRAAMVLAAVLTVTGPTVIGPLLALVRPQGPVGPTLRAEGILIDPIGATLALITYELALVVNPDDSLHMVAETVVVTLLAGAGIGWIAGVILSRALRLFLIPDHLAHPLALAAVVVTFIVSNTLQEEAGLLAVTVMGMWLARTAGSAAHRLTEFLDGLTPIVIGCLFLLLAARTSLGSLTSVLLPAVPFLLFLVLVVRPAAVFASTLFSRLTFKERLFVGLLAPRGIVAAAVSAVFGLRLAETGIAGADKIAPVVFVTIIATCVLYGFSAVPLARRLGISDTNATGFLIVGGSAFARAVGMQITAAGHRVVIVDTDGYNVRRARRLGLPAEHLSALSDEAVHDLDLRGVGSLLAVTPSDEVNSLAVHHHSRLFGRGNLFQLPSGGSGSVDESHFGRPLHSSFSEIDDRLRDGWAVRTVPSDLYETVSPASRVPLLACLGATGIVAVERDRQQPAEATAVIALVAPHVVDLLAREAASAT